MPEFHESLRMYERAVRVIPGQSQTFSKGWTQFPFGASPIYLDRAEGGHVWDVDGNEFIDWPMAIGPLLLGHNHPAVNRAIAAQLGRGIAFSMPNRGELELAERLVDWFPYAEQVRFGKNGSDATAGAVRAARAFTGREIVLCCGYHGWQDWFIGTTTRNAGVPEAVRQLAIPFAYNDLEGLRALFARLPGQVAAVIMEPMGVVEPVGGFLAEVKRLAQENGALLIFDECWTGFRLHRQGAYGRFGVAPDMACFGKAMGNGAPISAIVGRAEVMTVFEEIFFSFTFGGDMIGIAASLAVLEILASEPVLETASAIGQKLLDGVRELIRDAGLEAQVRIDGYPLRNVMAFQGDGHDGLLLKSIFQQEAIAGGILAAGYHAPSLAHTAADVEKTLDVYLRVFGAIRRGLDNGALSGVLRGRIVQPVFRKA